MGFKVEMDWTGAKRLCDKLVKELKSVDSVRAGYYTKAKYPDEKDDDGNVTKVGQLIRDVAVWNEWGTYNIPPRPFLRNSLKRQKEWVKFVIDNFDANQDGTTKLTSIAHAVGSMMKGAIQESLTDLKTPPNSPITINGGWMRNKKSGKWFKVKGKGSSNPLIDTGTLRNSVQFQVIKRKSGK